MKKIDFSFFVPHFSVKKEKVKKSEKRKFFVSVGPIVETFLNTSLFKNWFCHYLIGEGRDIKVVQSETKNN